MTLRFLRGQMGFMKARGYEVEIASSPGDELQAFGVEEDVRVHGIPMERRIAPLKDLVSLGRLWLKIRSINPEIVHSHTPKGGLLGMCAATLAGVPIRCYHLRGLPMMGVTGPKQTLLRWTERLSCALADEVFCVSHSLREVALNEGLCRPDKIRVLAGGSGNGVDSEGQYNPSRVGPRARSEMRSALGIAEDALVIGFVGRLVRDKGIVELSQAWKLLRDDNPLAVLLLIGPRETADAVPSHILKEFDADSRVICVGMVPTAAPYYPVMDVLTLPTYREGFPNVLLEAAAMNLPVVATRVPGCIDAVADCVTGRLVPARDAPALAEALSRYLSSRDLRKKAGASARDNVTTRFRQALIWTELLDRYSLLRSNLPTSSLAKSQHKSCT